MFQFFQQKKKANSKLYRLYHAFLSHQTLLVCIQLQNSTASHTTYIIQNATCVYIKVNFILKKKRKKKNNSNIFFAEIIF